jgi:hypothetical protein
MREWLAFKFIMHIIVLSIERIYSLDYIKSRMNNTVYVIQDVPGTREGRPKINIIGASQFGTLKVLLPENAQIILSAGPLIFKLRQLLQNYTPNDYLLLTGDPAIIGVACSIASDITNGKYNLLKWDKQERRYYPVEIDLFKKLIQRLDKGILRDYIRKKLERL